MSRLSTINISAMDANFLPFRCEFITRAGQRRGCRLADMTAARSFRRNQDFIRWWIAIGKGVLVIRMEVWIPGESWIIKGQCRCRIYYITRNAGTRPHCHVLDVALGGDYERKEVVRTMRYSGSYCTGERLQLCFCCLFQRNNLRISRACL